MPKTLKNPEDSYLFNGQEYTFLGWHLERTEEIGTVKDETPDFGDSEIAQTVTIQPGSRGRLVFRAVWTPESYVVYFYPGSAGVFPDHEPFISFGGLPANTLLAGSITVPTVVPNENDEFIGWRWEEGGEPARLYTEEEILAMCIKYQDLHFTARYQSDLKDNPEEKNPEKQKNLEENDSFGGFSGTEYSVSLDNANDFNVSGNSDVSEELQGRRLPQTGMHWWPVWGLGALGIMWFCIGIWSAKKK